MPKNILFESAIHQFFWAGRRLQTRLQAISGAEANRLAGWLRTLQLEHTGAGQLRVTWTIPAAGTYSFGYRAAKFYTRGDTTAHVRLQTESGQCDREDRVMAANCKFFDDELRAALAAAHLFEEVVLAKGFAAPTEHEARKAAEEHFHDAWAASEDLSQINVRKRNEACTAPEMRHLRKALGDLHGKTLLDIGCGLGEASVYFALEGARVTATDVSPGMCAATRELAALNGVTLETHVSAAEDLRLDERQFDIIYSGNTLHHANLESMMDRLLPHLRSDGVFASWDPVAYNPVIGLYRLIATKVRTDDEHPLRLRDIRSIASRFGTVEIRWFWFTTLLIFIGMVCVQFRNPNRERFWKKVIDEADAWAWLYRPLERCDRWLLKWIPFLRPLCWNVVVVGRQPVRPAAPPHA